MAAREPSEAPTERSGSTLGARLRASEAFADVRDYVDTAPTSPESTGATLAYRYPYRERQRCDREDRGLDPLELDSGVAATAGGASRRRILVVSLLVATGLAGLTTAGVVIAGDWSPPSVDGPTGVDPSPASSTTDHTGQDGEGSATSPSPTSRGADRTPAPSATASGAPPGTPTVPGSDPTPPSDPSTSPASSPSSKPTKPKPTRPTPTKPTPTKPAMAHAPPRTP